MNKHTPGPWGVNPERPCEVRALVDGRATGQLVADTSVVSVRVPWKENATLIAAAPELLAALENISAARSKQDHEFDVDAWYRQARAAIAKARGEK